VDFVFVWILDGYGWVELLMFYMLVVISSVLRVLVNVFGIFCFMFVVDVVDDVFDWLCFYGVEFVGEVV